MKIILIACLLFMQGCTLYISIGKSVDIEMSNAKVKSDIDADILPLLMEAFVAGQNYMGGADVGPLPEKIGD